MSNAEGRKARLVVITGLSGSGKSTAIRALEDVGFYCIDNLPVVLMSDVMELIHDDRIEHLGLVVDIRGRPFLDQAPGILDSLEADGAELDLLFLDASDETLIRRFSETRRRHPTAVEGSVREGIREERKRLQALLERADATIDTSRLTPHDLKRVISNRYAPSASSGLALNLMSFGFKHGVPPEADLVFDVRFLPNPFFVKGMREQRGIHSDVADFVLQHASAQGYLDRVHDLLEFALPHYEQEGKHYLTVAIGCTGGHHRSVAMTESLASRMAEYPRLRVDHRDIER